jgi:hypothetical protein
MHYNLLSTVLLKVPLIVDYYCSFDLQHAYPTVSK